MDLVRDYNYREKNILQREVIDIPKPSAGNYIVGFMDRK